MAIVLDSVSAGDSGLPTTGPLTWTHTIVSNTNGILLVALGANASGRITGVTYNGDAMTLIGSEVTDSNAGTLNWYGILTPDTGGNTVSVSLSESTFIRSASVAYTGVQQVLPSSTTSKINQANATSQQIDVTTVGNPSAIVLFNRAGGGVLSAGTGQTIRATNSDTFKIGDSVYSLTPGVNSMTTANDTETAIAQLAVEILDVNQPSPTGGFYYMSV